VNENAIKKEPEMQGFKIEQQKEILVHYKDFVVGQYFEDLIVDGKIIIELKCIKEITLIHKAKLLNYLKATGYKLGIIINFPNDKEGFEMERVPNFIE
jgi:GxxExxY protein